MNSMRAGTAVPLVAVCVCTRSRPLMLRRCLASLRRQTFDAARLTMKVIVVDNNPSPTVRPIYDEVWEDRLGELVHCPDPGIPMARNAALEAALCSGAGYIAFLDDDEIAPPNWLNALMRALQESGADAVQGGVRTFSADVEDFVLRDVALGETHSREACESLATCNVLFKAWPVEPPLSLRFDKAMQYTGGSDREFFMRAHKAGARLLRVHGLDVLEHVHEGRQSLAYQAGRSFAAGSNYFLRMCKNEPRPVAAVRIALRTLDKGLNGAGKLLAAAVLLAALRPGSALRLWRKGCASLCFAAGCLTPVAGVRAYPYRNIHGA